MSIAKLMYELHIYAPKAISTTTCTPTHSYLEVMEDEELQLAIALSASMDSHLPSEPPLSTTEETGRRKKHKRLILV